MLDPLQDLFGERMGGLLFLPALCGEHLNITYKKRENCTKKRIKLRFCYVYMNNEFFYAIYSCR